jgi:hypothetical protein
VIATIRMTALASAVGFLAIAEHARAQAADRFAQPTAVPPASARMDAPPQPVPSVTQRGAPEAGFGGRLTLGALYASMRTNSTSSTTLKLLNFETTPLKSLDHQPAAKSGPLPLVTFQLRYVFADTGTKLFVGMNRGDLLQFESFFEGGVQQPVGSAGKLSLAYLYSLGTNVWADPFVVGPGRRQTDRQPRGGRFSWEDIFGSGVQLHYGVWHVDIKQEQSGAFLGLNAEDRALLRRGGNVHQVEVARAFVAARAHQITPALLYRRQELQGQAVSSRTVDLKLRYVLGTRTLAFMLEGVIGRSGGDDPNPIFRQTQAERRYGGGVAVTLRNLFALRGWSAIATANYLTSLSNIDFYSARFFGAGGGVSVEF